MIAINALIRRLEFRLDELLDLRDGEEQVSERNFPSLLGVDLFNSRRRVNRRPRHRVNRTEIDPSLDASPRPAKMAPLASQRHAPAPRHAPRHRPVLDDRHRSRHVSSANTLDVAWRSWVLQGVVGAKCLIDWEEFSTLQNLGNRSLPLTVRSFRWCVLKTRKREYYVNETSAKRTLLPEFCWFHAEILLYSKHLREWLKQNIRISH